jgi:hypothetical protein
MFRKSLVDLNQYGVANSIPDSCLHVTQETLGKLCFLKRVMYLIVANKQPWKMMKCLPNGLVKPKGKYGKLERNTCTSRQS